MKKSQILAALALAFALGVVAPVAGTYAAEGDACTTDDGKAGTEAADGSCTATVTGGSNTTIEKRASKADVTTAANKVENYSVYKNYKTLIDAVAATEDGYTDVADALSALNGKIAAIDTDYKNATTIADAKKAAEGLKDYSKWSALVSAVNDATDQEIALSSRISAIEKAATNLGFTVSSTATDNATKLNELVAQAEALDEYDDYKAVIAAYSTATKSQTLFDNLGTALSKVGVSAATVLNSKTIANRVNTAKGYVGYNEYVTLAEAVAAARKNAVDATNKGNQDLIDAINDALQNATEVVPGEKISLDDLTNATDPGTQQPTDPDTKPGDDSNKDDNKTPTTPGTGIVSTAEGSASTTISIVAGLATALTALGAGVVAYRNARRSSEK